MDNKLFVRTMVGDWNGVVDIYKEDRRGHEARLTRSGHTALHIAVSDGQERIVEQLVRLITNAEQLGGQGRRKRKGALYLENEQGNTPLHLAAAMGNVRMCRCIAEADPELAGCHNEDRENPIFTAALHGKKDAFLWFHNICDSSKVYGYSTRNGGDSILHAAIAIECFDLAFQILHLYSDLVNYVNGEGLSPLHLLASKPSAFRSGSHLSCLNTILYNCIFVEDLTVSSVTLGDEKKDLKDKRKPRSPENYQTCFNFSELLGKLINIPEYCRKFASRSSTPVDTENPKESKSHFPNQGNQSTRKPNDHTEPSSPSHRFFFKCMNGLVFNQISQAMLLVLGVGFREINKIGMKKQKHTWAIQILNKMLELTLRNEHIGTGTQPLLPPPPSKQDDETKFYELTPKTMEGLLQIPSGISYSEAKNDKLGNEDIIRNRTQAMETKETTIMISRTKGLEELPVGIYKVNSDKSIILLAEEKKKQQEMRRVTPVLIATMNGITEMIELILQVFPMAIHDANSQRKNMVHQAVEHRQPHVYELLHKRKNVQETLFHALDNEGNSALHLAAVLRDYTPWNISATALQMQWEIKWYKFIKNSMPRNFFPRYNNKGETSEEVFMETHAGVAKEASQWLTKTSESSSLVATLVATVAFATAAAVPGGNNQGTGQPTLQKQQAFSLFAFSSLFALCFSVIALLTFLSIVTSRHPQKDCGRRLQNKFLIGLTSLIASIASMLVSFCSSHFFVIQDRLKIAALSLYAASLLVVTLVVVLQLPFYFDFILLNFSKRVPRRARF